ncbi:MAG: hypothetical protein JXR96_27330 [Deltaproteobacteria bacterium]|nr:hypothetical protein [Deltaproteobacteria bacterium]
MQSITIRRIGLAIICCFVMGLALWACGGDSGGVCLHDFGPDIECFEGWDKSDCDENGWDWVSGQTCEDLGYTSLCGGQSYTKPGACPL